MRALEVALHAFGTQHAAVERKVFPRLEADHLVVAHLELNAALLTAETAMSLDQPVRLDARREPHAGHRRQVRTETADDVQRIDRDLRHVRLPCVSSVTLVEVLAPQGALRQTKERATTPGTDFLIVPAARKLVTEAKLVFDDGEVAHHWHRRERLAAAAAPRLLVSSPRVLVEADAEL